MRKLARRETRGARDVARKALPGRRTRNDPALEQQAEQATAQALRGNVDVGRVLGRTPAPHVEQPASPGEPMPARVRADAEAAFGSSFEDVRVHRDPVAASLAAREGSRAFTAGRDVYFGEAEWQPTTDRGRALLYHELAHVVQQTGKKNRHG